jgi:transcriptional regulator with XRE-family HTH domain
LRYAKFGGGKVEKETLQDMLIKANVTQVEISRELNLSESHVSLLISGKRRMSIDYAAKFAERLEVTIDTIFHAVNFAKCKADERELCRDAGYRVNPKLSA